MAEPKPPPPTLLTARILWGAIIFSQFLLLGLLFTPGVVPRDAVPDPVYLPLLGGVAVLSAVGSYAFPAFLRRTAYRGVALATAPRDTGASSAAYRLETNSRGFSDPKAALGVALQRGFSPFIIGCAMNENVALFGFVLGFFGHGLLVVLPFFVVAWLLMLPRFPTERAFLAPLARAHGFEL